MGFGQAVASGFKNYFKFSGRASRSEYWWFSLFITLVGAVAVMIDNVVTPGQAYPEDIGILELTWNLVALIPSISVCVRRLHDVNRSGWWLLIILTGIGVFVILYWTIKRGHSNQNDYGPNPLNTVLLES